MKLFYLIYCFTIAMSYSQNNVNNTTTNKTTFNIKILNDDYVPKILNKDSNGITLINDIPLLENLLSTYQITNFYQTFSNFESIELLNIYTFECNNISLMTDLLHDFKGIYTEGELITNDILLDNESPDDYGFVLAQNDLNLIDAQKAWSFSTGSNTTIGISDYTFDIDHEELVGKLSGVASTVTGNTTVGYHGTKVSSVAVGNTNNGVGLASIGYDLKAKITNGGRTSFTTIKNLIENEGIRVFNFSWGSITNHSDYQTAIDEMHNLGGIIVAAAGNGTLSAQRGGGDYDPNSPYTAESYHYPASCDHVISVSSVHHNINYGTIDTHYYNATYSEHNRTHTHNDKVDIVTAGYKIPVAFKNNKYAPDIGTSFSSPQVSGTIGLMLDVNPNLSFEEVESILKLTTEDVYHLADNLPYLDQLGAGRLNAGDAVEMAHDMLDENKAIEINNRDFSRFDFELSNVNNINISNQSFTGSASVNFKAKKKISIKSKTVLKPNNTGRISLTIDTTQIINSLNNSENLKLLKNKFNEFGTYKLEYFLVDGLKEKVLFENGKSIFFNINKNNDSIVLNGFCNNSTLTIEDKGGYFNTLFRDKTTLLDCDNELEQEYRFFKNMSGNIYLKTYADKVFYDFTDDGLIIWSDEKEKLFFSKTKNNNLTSHQSITNNFNLIDQGYSVFPNPITNGDLNINIIDGIKTVLEFYNLHGSLIKKEVCNKVINHINIDSFEKGVYLINFKNENNEIVKRTKLVKH